MTGKPRVVMDQTAGRLFVVGTPIGNLEDITLRALRILKEVDCILAEDTRRTALLCHHYGIKTRLRSLHAHSEADQTPNIISELKEGRRFALVSDAGMPLIRDPGSILVQAAVAAAIAIESVPGPSAVITALSVSGLTWEAFRFVGFVPRRAASRTQLWREIATSEDASVFFEAPTRVIASLTELAAHVAAERIVAVCRELTKLHEEVIRGPVATVLASLQGGVRGEVTVVVSGASAADAQKQAVDPATIAASVAEWKAAGKSRSDVARLVSATFGIAHREAYLLSLR